MISINPYLTFKGNCEEAFNLYKEVFKAEFSYLGRFSDMPPNPEFPVIEEDKSKIMHVSLPIGEVTLMGCDAIGKEQTQIEFGSNYAVSINLDSTEEADRIFAKLSAKGKVIMPLERTFWGAYFGLFFDKFGIQWMINCQLDS